MPCESQTTASTAPEADKVRHQFCRLRLTLCYVQGKSGWRLLGTVVVAAASAGIIVGTFLLAWFSNAQYSKFANVLRLLLFVAPMVLVLILQFKLSWAAVGAIASGVALAGFFVVAAGISGRFTEFEAMVMLVMSGVVVSFLVRVRLLWDAARTES